MGLEFLIEFLTLDKNGSFFVFYALVLVLALILALYSIIPYVISSILHGTPLEKMHRKQRIIVLFVAIILFLFASSNLNMSKLEEVPNSNQIDQYIHDQKREYISIDEGYHHIGDVNNAKLFPEAPNNEGAFYSKDFDLLYKTEKMSLLMDTRDIDPDIQKGPASLFINNKFAAYLNEFVSTERLIDAQSKKIISNIVPVEIKIDPNLFKLGKNNIAVTVYEAEEGTFVLSDQGLAQTYLTNVDDIEIGKIKLKLMGEITD